MIPRRLQFERDDDRECILNLILDKLVWLGKHWLALASDEQVNDRKNDFIALLWSCLLTLLAMVQGPILWRIKLKKLSDS